MTCPLPSTSRRLPFALVGLLLVGCASTKPPTPSGIALLPDLKSALQGSADAPRPQAAAAPNPAPTQPAGDEFSLPVGGRSERRFSVVLNNATPELLFMALLSETPLSVAVDPGFKGPLSISLKDVTLREALDLLRELHGLEYKVIGRHILVAPAQMQTRIFTVDYPSFSRKGRSDTRVLSGSITGGSGGSTAASGSTGSGGGSGPTGSASSVSAESSHVSTTQSNDLWTEIETTVKLLIGQKDGRSVIVSPQTGNIVLRALPREIRAVQDYLEATRISVQRQVMLEAKVVEVQLRDSERTGINWAAFKLGLSTRATAGAVSPGGSLAPTGTIGDGLLTVTPGKALESAASAAGALLGLAFQTSNFAAVLDFLGTQGNTQVLSSPRIATMNNQKAVLKVGTDDFFITNISSTTTAVGNSTATTPNISVSPFFSGISLDVTPNIDAQGYITLHIHPAVSSVTERTKVINLGTQGTYSLPLASSDINESDAVVRAKDGNIIAIGGLMRQASMNSDSGIPGSEGTLWRKLLGGQTNSMSEKRELVILLKPTLVDPSVDDPEARRDSLQRLLDWTEAQPLKVAPAKSAPTQSSLPAEPTAPTAFKSLSVAASWQPAPMDSAPPATAATALATAATSNLFPTFGAAREPIFYAPNSRAATPAGAKPRRDRARPAKPRPYIGLTI